MGTVARKAAVSTIVVIAIVALALALWKLKVVIALVFLGFVLAAAMRPGIDRLAAWRIPRPAGLALHYLAIAGALALLLWLVGAARDRPGEPGARRGPRLRARGSTSRRSIHRG